jgi:hypothetical protein
VETSLSELISIIASELAKATREVQYSQLGAINDFVQSMEDRDEDFAERYISPADVTNLSLRKWGFDLFDERASVEVHYNKLVAADPGLKSAAASAKGRRPEMAQLVGAMRRQAIEALIRERRTLLRSLAERNEVPRVHIEAGELSLRLDLSVAERSLRSTPDMDRLMSAAGLAVRAASAPKRGAAAGESHQPPADRLEIVATVLTSDSGVAGTEASLTIKFKTF